MLLNEFIAKIHAPDDFTKKSKSIQTPLRKALPLQLIPICTLVLSPQPSPLPLAASLTEIHAHNVQTHWYCLGHLRLQVKYCSQMEAMDKGNSAGPALLLVETPLRYFLCCWNQFHYQCIVPVSFIHSNLCNICAYRRARIRPLYS